jgi:transcriptional regulator with XRE-family HTH domain
MTRTRPSSPFDTSDARCKFPVFGATCDAALTKSGRTASDIARECKISPEMMRAYRRGFAYPMDSTLAKLEAALGVTLSDKPRTGIMVRDVDLATLDAIAALATGAAQVSRDGDQYVFTVRVPAAA